jgi:hypothetical protein
MIIKIIAITIKGSRAIEKTKHDWDRKRVSTYNTIKIGQVESTYIKDKDNNFREHHLNLPHLTQQGQITKFKKTLNKSMLKINGSEINIDYKVVCEGVGTTTTEQTISSIN